ncbi:MAG: glycosyltransferase, partial [Hyphomonadaceae bacterium]
MASVLQVTPALDAGGVERTTIEIAEALSRAGMGALVASRGGRLENELAAAGGELIRVPLDTKNPFVIRANADRLAAIARERGVSLIHARSRAPGWSAYWAAKRLSLPFVTTYHGIYNGKTPWKMAYNSVMAKGDLVIANSHYTRDHVIRTHHVDPARVIAIPRGVDLDRFDPAKVAPGAAEAMRRAWSLAPSPGLVLLLAARLTRWKGQLLLIEAAARVLETRRGAISIVLAGDDQGRARYRLELVEAIRRYG